MEEIHYLLGHTCNLNCDFCFWEKKFPPASFKQAKKILDEIDRVGIKRITISGGEPTCARNFLKILEYAKKKNLEIILHTNGLLINKKLAGKIAKYIDRISLSLDASNEKMATKMRKMSFVKHTLLLIDLFNSLKIPVSIKTLVTKVNKKDIKNIGQLLKEKPIKYWSLLEFNPLGRGLINKNKFNLPQGEFQLIAKQTIKNFLEIKIKTREFKSRFEPYCFIVPNGEVYTNTKLDGDILIGDIKENSLEKIVKNMVNFNKR